MKESKLLDMQNKVVALTNVMQQVINEISYLRELSVGTLELIKNMPDYEEAVEKLKKQVTENPSKDKETKPSGEASE